MALPLSLLVPLSFIFVVSHRRYLGLTLRWVVALLSRLSQLLLVLWLRWLRWASKCLRTSSSKLGAFSLEVLSHSALEADILFWPFLARNAGLSRLCLHC